MNLIQLRRLQKGPEVEVIVFKDVVLENTIIPTDLFGNIRIIYKSCQPVQRNKEDLFGPKGVSMERKNPLPKNGSGFGNLNGLI